FRLPFPVTFNQMSWFVLSLLLVMLFGNLPPLSLINGALLKYVGIPVGLTWFMSQKTFDGKKPYSFLKSVITYFFRYKLTYAGKPIKRSEEHTSELQSRFDLVCRLLLEKKKKKHSTKQTKI